jgi:hypothetical protein
MLKFLIEAFKASKGRMPNNLEMLLLKQKAANQAIDERKIVNMFDRSPINPNKPIMGGKNIPETEDDIRRRLMKQNEQGIANLKNKLDDPEKKAMGGRIGYKFGTGKKGVEALLDLIKNKFGKKSITTADKAPIPPKTLERDMFKTADQNFKNKRMLDDDEYQDFLDEVGGADQLEAYDFDGTVGDAKRIIKEQKRYMDDMELEYKKGNLDPEPGDKSPARKRFLEKKLEEMEASGDKRLMTVDEIEELSSFDLGSEMDVAKTLAPKMVERMQLKQKYPGITDDLLDKILIDDNMQRKAEILATIDEAFKMMEKGKGADEILDTMKNVTRTKQAYGGVAGLLGERSRYQTGGDVAFDASDASVYGSSAITVTPETVADAFGNQVQQDMGNTYNPPLIEDVIQEKSVIEDTNKQGIMQNEKISGNPNGVGVNEPTPMPDRPITNLPGAEPITNLPVSDPTIRNQADIADPVTGKTIPKNFMDGFQSFLQESGAMNRPMTADVVSYRLPDGTVQQGNSTMRGLMNQYLKSIGQSPTTGVPASDRRINTNTSPLAQAAMANGGIARAGFMAGGMGRRGFLKMLAGLGAGIGAAKTGLLKFAGKEPAKQVAKEVVKQSTSTPPPYFFKLAEKIKILGDDATATTERVIAKSLKSKDGKSEYLLQEDMVTGDTIIKKINKEGDDMITDVEIMELRKGEDVVTKDGKAMRTPDEYEEVTEANMRIEGDVFNDPYYTDGIQIDDIMKEVGEQAPSIKKASGGIARMLGE